MWLMEVSTGCAWRGRPITAAVVRGAEMRAALQHLAGDPALWVAGDRSFPARAHHGGSGEQSNDDLCLYRQQRYSCAQQRCACPSAPRRGCPCHPARSEYRSAARPNRRSINVTSGSQSGRAGSTYSFAARRILLQPQHRLQQHEWRSCRPGLRYIGAQILHGETRGFALQPAIKLRQLVQQEMACRAADVASHRRCLVGKPVAPHAERDQRVVMRPHRPSLIVVRIERGMIRRQRADAPAAPHVFAHQPLYDAPARSGAIMPDQRHCPTLDATDSTFFFSPSRA